MEESLPYRLGSGPAHAHARRHWLMLDRFIHRTHREVNDQGYDATASKISYTCTGRPIRVSLRVADPPGVSRLHLHWPDRPEINGMMEPIVIAAHAHSILFKAIVPLEYLSFSYCYNFPVDYFVYSAFSSPPSLHRLPTCFIGGISTPDEDVYFKPHQRSQQRFMCDGQVGLLCHGDNGEFTVVNFTRTDTPTAEICLLHYHAPSASASLKEDVETEWKIKKVTIPEGSIVPRWVTDDILPIDGRFLCWIDCYQGILAVDVLLANDKRSKDQQLHYVPLPKEALLSDRIYPDGECPDPARCVSVTATGMIKLVCIESSRASPHFTIKSWTLHDIFGGRWQKCDTMDAAKFWDLTDSRRLPRVEPRYPLVSWTRPDVICFLLEEDHNTYWIIEVNMRDEMIRSHAIYINEEEEWYAHSPEVHWLMESRFMERLYDPMSLDLLFIRCFDEERKEMTLRTPFRDGSFDFGGYPYTSNTLYRNVFSGHSFIPSEISSYLGSVSPESMELSEIMQSAKQHCVLMEKRKLETEAAHQMERVTKWKTAESECGF